MEYLKELEGLEMKIHANIKDLISSSIITSKHMNTPCIPIDVFGYIELVLVGSEIRLVDSIGLHHSIDSDLELTDLIDIINVENTRRFKITEQYDLAQEIISNSGINIVTCGNCGSVVLHRTNVEEITCVSCGFTSEPCDFPDLYY